MTDGTCWDHWADWMIARARDTTPMAKMDIYAEDIKAMEDAAKQFRPIGRARNAAPEKPMAAQAKRRPRI